MATTTSPAPDDRTNKRLKQDEGPVSGIPPAPPPPPQQSPRYPPPPYSGGPPPSHLPPGGYYGGPPPPPQYGGHAPPPPHHWQGGPPPPGRYPPGPPPRGLSPDRMGGWQHGYRDPSPPKSRKPKQSEKGEDPYYSHGPPPPPPHSYPGPPPGYGPPPPHWQGGPPPPMYASQGTWTGKTPPRGLHHDPYRHEMDMHPYMSRGMQSIDDDASSMDGSGKDKGRGSYKCGRCGVPKKGHVCPYQPKLKRRPDEPAPQTRCAAVQVEMDEFMTLRRLNIKIQGFPESYATEPYATAESMLSAEPFSHPPHTTSKGGQSRMHPVALMGNNGMPIAEQIESRDAGEADDSLLDEEALIIDAV